MSSAPVSSRVGSGTGDASTSSFRLSSRPVVAATSAARSGVVGSVASWVFSSSMRVILPDSSELELPDGATGLDAAQAIGPRLAKEAVLIRSNGSVRDLRLPLADGERIQILTTRDKDDPDALYVLRHSAAHLLAEAVRRLYPGVKVAIGPPIENGFYYDFEFPEPISEEDLARLEAEIQRQINEGREWERLEVSRASSRDLLPDTQVFRKRPPRADARLGRALQSFADLRTGDFVVHEDHGIGKLLGFETKTVAGVTRDYLFLAFRGDDRLYVPPSFESEGVPASAPT